MDRFLDSPPQAYESPIPVQARHTIKLGDPIGPAETPEQAAVRAEAIYLQAMNGELGEERQALVAAEAKLAGLDLTPETVPELLEAHRAKIDEYGQKFAESFRHRAPVLLGHLAEDVANATEDPAAMHAMLEERLAPVWTSVDDPLMWLDEPVYPDLFTAQYDDVNRNVRLNYAALITGAVQPEHPLVPDREFFDALAEHEAFHTLMARWYDPEGEGRDVTITNGLFFNNGHGEWLNEGTIEKYREDTFGEHNFTYEGAVLALAVADAADPGLQQARLRAAVLNEDHSGMIGRLELLFGPGAPETLEKSITAFDTRAYASEIVQYKASLMKLLPEDKRAVGGRAFDKVAQRLHPSVPPGRHID
jgi:hypothetical protein